MDPESNSESFENEKSKKKKKKKRKHCGFIDSDISAGNQCSVTKQFSELNYIFYP